MTEEATTKEQPTEQFEFRAEIQQLLHILVHSLYTEREIFLRELISNASDALNRFQFEMLTREAEDVVSPDAPLEIRITLDEDARTLTISDTGIGMTRAEVIENLGTIARSGAAAFLKALQERPSQASEIIGQFGVGFYSVFMVADRVEVVSRSYLPEAEAVRWVSSGGESYEIAPADKETRGTDVIVHLKEDAEEFAKAWRVKNIVKRHSDYVAFPIYVGDERVNQQTALWRQSPRDVQQEAYNEFYKQLTLSQEPPLATVHVSAEVPYDIHAILFVPSGRERGIMSLGQEQGLKLYSRKVLIQESTTDLLPNYLRFVDGVVDSEDLPLNISRETVQSNRVMVNMKRTLTGKMLKELERLAEEDPERYEQFWEEFGIFIKEGVATEWGAQDELAPLLRFHSSETEEEETWTSLRAYKERMGEEQEAIYYVLGEDLRSVRRSPHLDPFRARDIEVLFLVEPIDSFMLSNLHEFDGTPLKNVGDPDLDLPPLEEEEEEQREAAPQETFDKLVERARAVLGERVTDVRESQRLRDNPVRLAVTDETFNPTMDRVRRLLGEQEGQEYEVPKRALELNRRHPIVRNLAALAASDVDDPLLDIGIEQLYESALLQEGLHPNPADMVPRIQQLLEWAAERRAKS
ncbi:MAG: molecular chaperone HtpG [Chloroflexota bacterium]|nr:molecular chaperone HtpG [Chloroflexota bacterium]